MDRLCLRTLPEVARRVAVPAYDRAAATASVVHLGVGAFHRAHQAVFHDDLLAAGRTDAGICGVGVLEADRAVHEALREQDGLYALLVKHPDGTVEARVVGSELDHLLAPDDPEAVLARMADPAVRMVTITITEGAWGRTDHGPEPTAFGLVAEALRRRRADGTPAFAVLNCDNLPGNGEVARRAIGRVAGEELVQDVAFPDAMVDRITPVTTDADRAVAAELLGVEDRAPVVCEPFRAWVLEDGDGPWRAYGEVGARLVPDVAPYERMKLRLLNAGHQAVAHLGLLRGHTYVHEAMADPEVAGFLQAFLDESQPTVTGVPDDELAAFRAALPERFANAPIGDTLARLVVQEEDRLREWVLPIVRDRDGDAPRADEVLGFWAQRTGGDPQALGR